MPFVSNLRFNYVEVFADNLLTDMLVIYISKAVGYLGKISASKQLFACFSNMLTFSFGMLKIFTLYTNT